MIVLTQNDLSTIRNLDFEISNGAYFDYLPIWNVDVEDDSFEILKHMFIILKYGIYDKPQIFMRLLDRTCFEINSDNNISIVSKRPFGNSDIFGDVITLTGTSDPEETLKSYIEWLGRIFKEFELYKYSFDINIPNYISHNIKDIMLIHNIGNDRKLKINKIIGNEQSIVKKY